LGIRCGDSQKEECSKGELAESGADRRLHINGFLLTIRNVHGRRGAAIGGRQI